MTSSAQSWQHDLEVQFLERLRARYAEQGFSFIIHPTPAQLPDFFGTYRPDAIAQKPGINIAIEVKRRPTPEVQRSLQEIRRLFDRHPEWQFTVSYMGSDPLLSLAIPVASPAAIRSGIGEVKTLLEQGQRRAAFIMAWSLLEAALHRLDNETGTRPRTPGTVIQTLAMLGYFDPETERRIRPLIEVRNRIVHGDLQAEPPAEAVQQLLSAITETLKGEA
jgi:uncharacterized protein YutE (UPF0331/DUF86 family)